MFIETLLTNPIYFIRYVIIIILSITLHELAHGWAAITQGDDTPIKAGHMTPNPIVHMGVSSMIMLCIAGIAWGQMPVNPANFRSYKWGNIWVAAAGPLMNLGLGILFIALLRLSYVPALSGILSYEFLFIAALINLVLFLFNLLPIPPLDGFHVFSEFFPGLKSLNNSPFGLFLLVIIFVTPQVGNSLFGAAQWMLNTILSTMFF